MKRKASVVATLFLIITSMIFSTVAANVSGWAKQDVETYKGYGLLPQKLGDDLTKEITREEFCAITVSLFEKQKGEITEYENTPFEDTKDIEVFKAYKAGIVKGVSETQFMPNANISRQEICVMFLRLVNLVRPDLVLTQEYYIFDDADEIAPWADNAIQGMYKLGIINGVDKAGVVIDPLGLTTKEQAVVMALRLYENCILQNQPGQNLSVRTQTANTIAAGDSFSLCITDGDTLYGWGKNQEYQLGIGNNNDVGRYTQKIVKNARSVAAGPAHGFAIDNAGNLYGWGQNQYGQLGDGTTQAKATPVLIMEGAAYVIALQDHTFVIKTDGSLWAFGSGKNYKLGTGSNKDELKPQKILDNVAKVSAFSDYCVALTKNGDVYHWGQNRIESILFDEDIALQAPQYVMGDAIDIAAGNAHALAIKGDGSLWAFGKNTFGQLGNAQTSTSVSAPIQVMDSVAYIAAGYDLSLAVTQSGTLYAFGNNTDGRIGNGAYAKDGPVLSPERIMDGVSKVFVNGNSVFALTTDAKLYGWGANYAYQLGVGDNKDKRLPAYIGDNVSNIAFGVNHVMLLKTNRELCCYGENTHWQTSNVTKISTAPYTQPVKYLENALIIS